MSFLCTSSSRGEFSFIAHSEFHEETEEEQKRKTNSDVFPIYLLEEDIKNELDGCEKKGVLTHTMVASGLSSLKYNLEAGGWVLTKLALTDMKLSDVKILSQYNHVTWLDISYNHIHDMQFLHNATALEYLTLEQNHIETLLVLRQGLFRLRVLNLSFNRIHRIPCDFSRQFRVLTHLIMSHNTITHIQGLNFKHLRFLRVLDLSFNKLKRLENLTALNIKELYVQNNEICEYLSGNEGFISNKYLHTVDISHNYLSSLELFSSALSLVKIIAANNQINCSSEILQLSNLYKLRELNLADNPLTSWGFYKRYVTSAIKRLLILDNEYVSEINMESNENISKHYFSDDHFLRNYHMNVTVPSIGNNVPIISRNEADIFIILVGTLGCYSDEIYREVLGKRRPNIHVLKKITTSCFENQNTVIVSHKKFQKLLKRGDFIAVVDYYNIKYGYSKKEIYDCFQEGKICLTDMDLKAALSVRALGYKPFLILVTMNNLEHQKSLLLNKFAFNAFQNANATLINKKSSQSTLKRTKCSTIDKNCSSSSATCSELSNQAEDDNSSLYSWHNCHTPVIIEGHDIEQKVQNILEAPSEYSISNENQKEIHIGCQEITRKNSKKKHGTFRKSPQNRKLLTKELLVSNAKETFLKDFSSTTQFYEEFYNEHREIFYSSIDDSDNITEKFTTLLDMIIVNHRATKIQDPLVSDPLYESYVERILEIITS